MDVDDNSHDQSSAGAEHSSRYAQTMNATALTEADIAYIRDNFRALADLCRERGDDLELVQALVRERRVPAPSYLLPDGTEMVPADYFALIDRAGGPDQLRADFERRHRAAGGANDALEGDWDGYLDGVYGICLRSVSPESIVRKSQLVESITALLEDSAPNETAWTLQLQRQVNELDALEREFSPDYDRHRFERPPSRDLLIAKAHQRFPDLFAFE
jgi:hypothetical protein